MSDMERTLVISVGNDKQKRIPCSLCTQFYNVYNDGINNTFSEHIFSLSLEEGRYLGKVGQ